jgi:putative endonuclease
MLTRISLRSIRATLAVSVMAGLVPAIHVLLNRRMRGGWLYFMTNRRNGVLYAGVTSNLPRRAFEHRAGLVKGFTKRYGLKMLVYCERYDDIRLAIQREKTVKHWPRAWKARLIHAENPEWDDLYDTLI